MNILDYTPFIAIGALVLVGIGVLAWYLFNKRKKAPLTPHAIPPLPSQKEAANRFSPLPQTATLHPQAVTTTGSKGKKYMYGGAVALLIMMVLTVSYFVSTQKPQTTKQQAAPAPNTNQYVHLVKPIGEVRGDKLVAGGLFGYYSSTGADVAPQPPITVTVQVDIYHCPDISDPDATSCNQKVGTDKQSAILNWGDRQIEIIGGTLMEDRCGVYQVKSTYLPYNPDEVPSDIPSAGSAIYSWGKACGAPTSSVIPSPTCNPLATGPAACGTPLPSEPAPNITSDAVSPPATSPTKPPATTPSATPTPIATATPTPTVGSGSGTSANPTSSPTPTEIILAKASASATVIPTVASAAPTIPSAGSAVAYFAIGIPLLLIILAFAL